MSQRKNWFGTAADILTGSRLVIAGMILYLGKTQSSEALTSVSLLCLLGWTTDTIDGHFARKSSPPHNSLIGRNDRAVDLIMIFAGWLYLIASGFLPKWKAGIYTLGAFLTVLRFRSKFVLTTVEIIPALAIPITTLKYEPKLGLVWILWALSAAVLDHKRLKVRIGILLESRSHIHPKKTI